MCKIRTSLCLSKWNTGDQLFCNRIFPWVTHCCTLFTFSERLDTLFFQYCINLDIRTIWIVLKWDRMWTSLEKCYPYQNTQFSRVFFTLFVFKSSIHRNVALDCSWHGNISICKIHSGTLTHFSFYSQYKKGANCSPVSGLWERLMYCNFMAVHILHDNV